MIDLTQPGQHLHRFRFYSQPSCNLQQTMSSLLVLSLHTFLRRVLNATGTLDPGTSKDTIDGGEWSFGAGNLPFTIGVSVFFFLFVVGCGFGSKKVYHHYHPDGTY